MFPRITKINRRTGIKTALKINNSNFSNRFQTQRLGLITKLSNADISTNVSTFEIIHLLNKHTIITGGSCKFGDKCSYAHGDAELRTAQSTQAGSKMKQTGGVNNQMPPPMGMDGMQNMNQFPGMMMQNQMGFPSQNMYNIDPNMNMQMMFNPQGSGNDPQNQQFGMIPNQFMQMQNQLMGIQLQQQ